MRLLPGDHDLFLRLLPAVYARRTTNDFFDETLRLIGGLVHFDYGGWSTYVLADPPRLAQVVESELRMTPHLVTMFEQAIYSHPFPGYWINSRDVTALMLSDFSSVAYSSVAGIMNAYHALDVKHDLSLPVFFGKTQSVALSLFRKARAFSERDRFIMNLLQPHLQRARENAVLVDRTTGEPTKACVHAFAPGLTLKEAEVSQWLVMGKTNWEIGVILGISPRTVEKHVEGMLKKLNVPNRTMLALRITTSQPSRESR